MIVAVTDASHKRKRKRKRKRYDQVRRVPMQRLGEGIARRYFGDLLKMLRMLEELTRMRVFPMLEPLVSFRDSERGQLPTRRDDVDDEIDRIVSGLEVEFQTFQPESALEVLARQRGIELNDFNREQVRRQFRALIGLDVIGSLPNGPQILEQWVGDNTDLIVTMRRTYFEQLRGILRREIRLGTRHEEIAKMIRKRFKTTRNQAKLIARDQVSKLNGELTRERQVDAGVEQFVWRTSRDARVRASHRALEGKTFNWPEGHPTERIPGWPINCRCVAEPVFEDIDAGEREGLLGGPAESVAPFPDLPFARRPPPL